MTFGRVRSWTVGRVRPWTVTHDGVTLNVRLTPKGGRDSIDGIETLADGRPVLRARVRAVPADGAANEALVQLLAKHLHVAPRDVSLIAGASARIKRLAIAGDGQTLAIALERLDNPPPG